MLTPLNNKFIFSQSEAILISPHSDTTSLADTLQISNIYITVTKGPPGQK